MRCSDRAAAEFAARQAVRKQAKDVRRGDQVRTADHGWVTVQEVGHTDTDRLDLDIGTHVIPLTRGVWLTVKEVIAN